MLQTSRTAVAARRVSSKDDRRCRPPGSDFISHAVVTLNNPVVAPIQRHRHDDGAAKRL